MDNWIDTLRELRAQDEAACIVTVASVRGSAPRETGTRMIVTANKTYGTIGGGQLEYQCARIAAGRLTNSGDSSALLRRFPLGSNCGQCCGGVVEILFEDVIDAETNWFERVNQHYRERCPAVVVSSTRSGHAVIASDVVENFGLSDDDWLAARQQAAAISQDADANPQDDELIDGLFYQSLNGRDFSVAIFGAGHVGSALVATLAQLNCDVRWVDSRRDIFPASLPANVQAIESARPVIEVAALPSNTYFLVMTHSHALDYELCEQILQRDDFAYCGLIGSLSKRRRFERLMRKQGLPEPRLEKLTCPIGVPMIDGKSPQEIAIAVAAELLQIQSASASNAVTTGAVRLSVI